jgi:SAM-dependent methyltransferase
LADAMSKPRPMPALSRGLWNLYGRCYDAITRLAPYREMVDEVARALAVAPGMRVLDAGCGTGVLAERLAEQCPEIRYLGVDLSPAMLARARRRRAWPANFTFAETDLDEALEHDASGFQRIASINVIWTLPDPATTLARMTAALDPGGRMVHTTPRLAFKPHVIVWQHLRAQRGWGVLRGLLGVPLLLVAGLLNLLLVLQSARLARAPRAHQRWSEAGLVSLLRDAGARVEPVRPCYAGQGLLVSAERPTPASPST